MSVGNGDAFEADVVATTGTWPSAPKWWSYSTMREFEECPRRWTLRRADYEGIWDRKGYPDRPTIPALAGDVMHGALETVIGALATAGCSSVSSPGATSVMRDLGGFTALLTRITDARLLGLEGNPRAQARIEALRDGLRLRIPHMRRVVQAVVSMTEMVSADTEARPAPGQDREPLSAGSHPEVELRAASIGWLGRADLLTIDGVGCHITDYKTGIRAAHHAEQIRTYALLWNLDADINPSHLLATGLTLRYADGDVAVEAPTAKELDSLRQELVDRKAAALQQMGQRPPIARPAPETCDGCPVRHLCPEYWAALDRKVDFQDGEPSFSDVELRLSGRLGPKSWGAVVVHGPRRQSRAVLRTIADATVFAAPSNQRVLDAGIAWDDESEALVVTMTAWTEAHAVIT